MTTTFEELFNQSVLSVVAPHASLGLPRQSDSLEAWTDWLGRLEQDAADRRMAFFDENLEFLLTLRFPESEGNPDRDDEDEDEDDDDSNNNNDAADVDPKKPPAHLLSFLAHLQISYDASYIAPLAQPIHPAPPSPLPLASVQEVSLDEPLDRPPVPPRTHSIRLGAGLGTGAPPQTQKHPSIFPPHTPHPVPAAAEPDRAYVQAQGTPLRAGVWGEGPGGAADAFVLLWDALARAWVAVFRMAVVVSFLPTKTADPLLCLTVSTTLREKPVLVTPPRQALVALIEAAEGQGLLAGPKSPGTNGEGVNDAFDMNGMEEINLFEGLTIGTTFGSNGSEPPLVLPSTRLGSTIRHQAFSLPSLDSMATSPLQSSSLTPLSSRTAHPTLRKSFRKTLQTVSDFHVRMRTVFVPYFMLPQARAWKARNSKRPTNGDAKASNDSEDDDLDAELVHERELRETGNEEHTVILCVELENKGTSVVGFAVESVNISVGGEGAQTRLIGWGESAVGEPEAVFPLLIGPQEQYNLLYAVSFMRSPEADEFSLARGRSLPGAPNVLQLQRAVAIIINGRPYDDLPEPDQDAHEKTKDKPSPLSFPTHTFPSRWNCVLDLAAQVPGANIVDSGTGLAGQYDALPTPASPFPVTASRTNFSRPTSAPITQSMRPHTPGSGASTPVPAVAGTKRFTLGMLDMSVQSPRDSALAKPPPSPMNYRSDTSLLNPTNQRDMLAQSGLSSPVSTTPVGGMSPNPMGQGRAAYIPPSLTVPTLNRTPATTYAPLSAPLPPPLSAAARPGSFAHMQADSLSLMSPAAYEGIPPTPAYPAFPPSPAPPTPHWQGPLAGLQSGEVGPPVEIPREKRQSAPGIPPTPGPRVGTGGGFAQMQMQAKSEVALRGEGPREPVVVSVGLLRREDVEGGGGRDSRIYPLDRFTLDIFVFNRSSWTRRFEVSCPDRRTQRRDRVTEGVRGGRDEADDPPGILPLENRVRVGPLLPSTCQSVRMDFVALKPGVHSIEVLTLTDIQSGFTMNLRSVMDVVVHEHEHTTRQS